MKKRDFFKVIGLGVVAGAVSIPAFARVAGSAPAAIEPPSLGVEKDFKSIATLEVKIIDMVNDGNRTVLVDSTKPVVIPEAKVPLAIVFSENDDETVRMTVFSKEDNGRWIEKNFSYAGLQSSQVLQPYGIILNLYAHR